MTPSRQRWVPTVILLAAVYLIVGLVFAALAGSAGSNQIRVAWRLAAFAASALAFGAHIWYEHSRLRNTPRTIAWHAAAAVALGAFALAGAANVHGHFVGSGNPRLLVVAFIAWPLLCGLPAFVVALGAAAGLRSMRHEQNANSS